MASKVLRMARASFLVSATILILGCEDEAFVGAPCDMIGSTEACGGEGLVCDDVEGEPLCLAVCDKQEDCPEDQSCNGVSKSNIKACHPNDDPI